MITEKQIDRIIYSTWDFQQALSALTFLREECDFSDKYITSKLRKFRCYEATIIISMARPFEQSKGCSVLNLKAINYSMSNEEKDILKQVKKLRNKIIAHSDEDEMHFNATLIEMDKDLPHLPFIRYMEGLYISSESYLKIESLLRGLIRAIELFIFKYSQEKPEMFVKYKLPASIGRPNA